MFMTIIRSITITLTLNSDNLVCIIAQVGALNAQPIFNAIIDTPLHAQFIINPQAISVSRQLCFGKFSITYAVASREKEEDLSVVNDVDILLRRRDTQIRLRAAPFLYLS